MASITSVEQLRAAISELEYDSRQKEKSIRKGITLTVDSLRPYNLIKSLFGSFFKGMESSQTILPYTPLKGNFKAGLVQTAVAFGTSLLVRKFLRKKA
jgi:hypothetical protein